MISLQVIIILGKIFILTFLISLFFSYLLYNFYASFWTFKSKETEKKKSSNSQPHHDVVSLICWVFQLTSCLTTLHFFPGITKRKSWSLHQCNLAQRKINGWSRALLVYTIKHYLLLLNVLYSCTYPIHHNIGAFKNIILQLDDLVRCHYGWNKNFCVAYNHRICYISRQEENIYMCLIIYIKGKLSHQNRKWNEKTFSFCSLYLWVEKEKKEKKKGCSC